MQRVYFPEPEFEYSGLIRVTPQQHYTYPPPWPMHGVVIYTQMQKRTKHSDLTTAWLGLWA